MGENKKNGYVNYRIEFEENEKEEREGGNLTKNIRVAPKFIGMSKIN